MYENLWSRITFTDTRKPENNIGSQLVGDRGHFDSQSIRSSVLDYVYANGRRYHAFRAGNWPVYVVQAVCRTTLIFNKTER